MASERIEVVKTGSKVERRRLKRPCLDRISLESMYENNATKLICYLEIFYRSRMIYTYSAEIGSEPALMTCTLVRPAHAIIY